jgi:hypothetical protein
MTRNRITASVQTIEVARPDAGTLQRGSGVLILL